MKPILCWNCGKKLDWEGLEMTGTNADRIRAMDDEELAAFLFKWQVNFAGEFIQNGLTNIMCLSEMREWMKEPGKPHPIFEEWDTE